MLHKQLFLIVTVCGALSNPGNGSVSTDGTVVGATATYYSDYGYVLAGDSIPTCHIGGWSGSEPTCTG